LDGYDGLLYIVFIWKRHYIDRSNTPQQNRPKKQPHI
jgi:hypothetical protein